MYHGERFNAWTHLVGAVLASIGALCLLVQALWEGEPLKIGSVAVYGASLVLLYVVSTVYHSVRGRAKAIMRKLDHLSIYLLIAGSYTPFCVVSLQGPWGWSLLGLVWGMALVGILQELKPRSEARRLSLVIYALMGWSAVLALEPLASALGPGGLGWLLAGGIFYTVGIVFFVLDRRLRHGHGIWHLFVIAGSTLHYVTVMLYVV